MSKILEANLVFVLVTCGIAIASLVFNILIFNEVNISSSPVPSTETPDITASSVPSSTSSPLPECKAPGKVSTDPGWQSAADQLLRGLDRTIDPCSDFYAYSCQSFLTNDTNPDSVSDESRMKINLAIADYLDKVDVDKANDYEIIAKKAYEVCSVSMTETLSPGIMKGRMDEVQADLLEYIQFPLFGFKSKDASLEALFTKIGRTERQFFVTILLDSGASVDAKNNKKTAMYIDQAFVLLPRDYYILPQFISELQNYAEALAELLREYSAMIGTGATCSNHDNSEDCIVEFTQWVVQFEVQIALALWDESENHNMKLKYNAFKLAPGPDNLRATFKSVPIDSYVLAITDGMRPEDFDTNTNIVIEHSSYFMWLDALFDSDAVTTDQLTNYLALMFLADTANFHYFGAVGNSNRRDGSAAPLLGLEARRFNTIKKRRGAGRLDHRSSQTSLAQTPDEIRNYCVDIQLIFMPYAPGYIYVKNLRDDKRVVQEDAKKHMTRIIDEFSDMIDSLDWMDAAGKENAHAKSHELLVNIGWPEWFEPFNDVSDATVDKYHEDYMAIKDATTWWQALKALKGGVETREYWRMLKQTDKTKGTEDIRNNFLQSPAMVNAWYQPERNSLTVPLASLAPPYYSLDWPLAYRYAGLGATGGNQLASAYDDKGVQFGPDGMLSDCDFTHCSIMDDKSREGFTDMTQCVVQQYNMQCCPVKTGNVRCANGEHTLSANMADIAGQQAAYMAYQSYIEEERNGEPEDLLPGLEDLSANQVFWLSYGFSWCSTQNPGSQLGNRKYSPSICRVNQPMQDIPQFGRDFECKRGSTLYPKDEDRCKVWVGY